MRHTVYILIHPQLGGLGWVPVGDFTTRKAASAKRAELIRNGHEPRRVGINIA